MTPEYIDLPPQDGAPEQLFVALHGESSTPDAMLPLAQALQRTFRRAAVVIPEGFDAFEGGSSGREWFSTHAIDEAARPGRVAAALPRLVEFVRQQQERWKVFPIATALAGFSQGAVMALEASAQVDGLGGRVLAFSGRYARLPRTAPQYTTIHLFHGALDEVIPVVHANAALEHLAGLNGDVTLDVAHEIGHTLHPVLIDLAIERLLGRIPLRSWQRALGAVVLPRRPSEETE